MKKFLKAAGTIIGLILLYTILQIVFTEVAIYAAGLYAYMQGKVPAGFDGFSLEKATAFVMNSEYSTWALAISLLLSALAMLWYLVQFGYFTFRRNFFTSMSSNALLLSTALIFCSMFFLNTAVQLVNEYYPIPDLMEDTFAGLTHNILGVISIAVVAPVLEEVLFRGAIQGYLMRRFGNPYVGIVVASLVFGIFHLNPIQVVYATLLGLIFGWIYYRTRSLLSVIVGHVLNNSLATVGMLFFGDVEEEIISSGNIGHIIASVAVFASFSLFLALKLNASLPPVVSPWQEVGETADNESLI